ncbi:MAG: TetR/AcrR family transcriptional regulator [Acidimicrobiia bacterium]|nr:TetR/AcrR family transcriptional regulator [Acidimicrobiia bacterium]
MKAKRQYTMSARADGVATTRQRIMAAAKALLLEEHYEDVTLASIARAAETSHQTVLNHFESKEGVAKAVAAELAAETSAARAVAKAGDAADVVRVLVGEYEHLGDANVRWAVLSDRLGDLASALDEARVQHQAWLESLFDEQLPRDARSRRRAVNALHAATDVYTWKLLRRDLHLSRTETEKTMTALVVGVLNGDNR